MLSRRRRTLDPVQVARGRSGDSFEEYAREFGVRLHQLRMERGLTQERLAAAADITTYTYRKLEKGESNPGTPANPRLRTLLALAEVLDVRLAEILPPDTPQVAVGR
jgi:transcriptional regulator with XRE-family HTH domain